MEISKETAEKVVEICKRRGIIFPTAEIYGGVGGFFEYGPIGVLLKRKFIDYWRDYFIKSEENIVEIEGCVVLPDSVWEASGHLKSFVDPLTQCKKCKAMRRADELIQEKTGKFVEGLSTEELTKIIREEKIKCPKCGGEFGDVKLFNLLLKTQIGPVEGESASLRPETAQNIFINFKRIFNTARGKLPFGIAQVGKSFRNEISPRQFIVRLREFTQCEIEMFLDPEKLNECPKFDEVANVKITIYTREAQKSGSEPFEITVKEAVEKGIVPNKWMAYFMAKEFLWFQTLGIPREALRFRHMLPEETPHYSKGNFDLEIKFDFGWKECVGNAYRSDYDLSQHMKHSGEDLTVVTKEGRKIIPHVIEPSFGVERPLLAILLYCFREGKERGWSWFDFPPKIAPYVAGVFPLVSKDGLPEKAREVYNMLRKDFDIFYDESGSIGKRYARSDEIGVLSSITIDYQTLKDDTVTIRDRNTTNQVRVKINDLKNVLTKLLEGERLEKVGKTQREVLNS
jgi:glycyl-tRNA synthetase